MPVRVDLVDRSYAVHIGEGLLARLGPMMLNELREKPQRVLLVVDSGLPAHPVDTAVRSLESAGLYVTRHVVAGGEESKSFAPLEELVARLASARLTRSDVLISLAGGATADLAGFGASIYRRGIRVVHCPTTLLAMVDASVGGKTGINIFADGVLKKNMVGAFWQPSTVIADTSTLRSLPKREFRAGLAECIKHSLISGHVNDPALFAYTQANLTRIHAQDQPTITQLIERNIAVKAAFVSGDEREEADDIHGGRALLNLGHTFAHVIEGLRDVTAESYPAPLFHGECVGLGLIAAASTAVNLSIFPPTQLASLRTLITHSGLPSKVQGLPNAANLMALMRDDKKVRSGVLRIILPTKDARAVVVSDPDPDAIVAGWEAIRASPTL